MNDAGRLESKASRPAHSRAFETGSLHMIQSIGKKRTKEEGARPGNIGKLKWDEITKGCALALSRMGRSALYGPVLIPLKNAG